MKQVHAAAIALLCCAFSAILTPAAAQHEHHRVVPLDSLTARAERAAVQLRSGATIVDVRASATAGGSIVDLLRTVPGVELDPNGRISMRGSPSVVVMMNGRRVPLNGDALVAFLRQMPASALERIEAGTSASLRYGADGAGVVNLVFRDNTARRTDMRSMAGSIATEDHYMGSVTATGDVGDLLSWDAMYSLSSMRPRINSKTTRWSIVPGDLPLQTDQASRAREKHRLHSVLAGAAVTPTANTSLALRGTYSWMDGTYQNSSAFIYTNAAGNTGTSSTSSVLEHVIPSGELSAIARVDLGTIRFTSEARTSFVDEDFRGDYYDAAADYRYLTTAMVSHHRENVLRNDVGLRFSRIGLDVGHESRFHTTTSAHDATHYDAILSQAYRYETDVHAGYVTAHRSVGGLRAEVGLRVEAERTHIKLEPTITARRVVRVFPNVTGEWTDTRRPLVYRIAYGRRIHRPGAEMLNPFSMGGDDMNEIIGNPSLLPEVSDQIEFGVERHGALLTLQVTPFFRRTRDAIRPLKTATERGGTVTTLENVARTRAVGGDGSMRARLTNGAVVTLAGSVAHMETIADVFSSSGVYATARLTVDLRLSENTTAQLYAYRRSAQAIEQGEIMPAFTSELALMQRLARDRARVTLRLNDPLRSDRLEFRVADASFTQQSRRRTARPLLSLFASYAVGGSPREDAPVRPEGPARIF